MKVSELIENLKVKNIDDYEVYACDIANMLDKFEVKDHVVINNDKKFIILTNL